ncbi:Protein of uncharacterised function (DUF3461) [Serratia fonticola]|uniref:Protein of uncharacterized function (DUF3461) n=1 Tax=Serratia fonticola TaxID=47917 RepID=A0A4U9V4C8_SERFO|nr:Protein of uncharacterised function (DUF3461) [Serratia fonticola]
MADNAGQGYKEIHEINPNLRYVIDELDQLCQRDQVEVDLKRKILDDLQHLPKRGHQQDCRDRIRSGKADTR